MHDPPGDVPIGPFLRLRGYDPSDGSWTGSVLCGIKGDLVPSLILRDPVPTEADPLSGDITPPLEPLLLDRFEGWSFWRFDLRLPIAPTTSTRVDYRLDFPEQPWWSFHLAPRDELWHWAFYTCAGFDSWTSQEHQEGMWRGTQPLWRDLLAVHRHRPLHALVSGGDTLYNDDVWNQPALVSWLQSGEREERLAHPFTPDMRKEVDRYYFIHYCRHFAQEATRRAYASIPSVNTWDDHDIFDGWGSYPADLQTCSVFEGIFQSARRFYLLFQLHTHEGRLAEDGFVAVEGGANQLVMLGPLLALMLPDQRSCRSRWQVIDPRAHLELMLRALHLAPSVKHVCFVATVPLVYPHITGSHGILRLFDRAYRTQFLHNLLRWTGAAAKIMSFLDEPDLLDDLRDQYNAPAHRDERRYLIENLQMIAKVRRARVTLLSGDVHLAGSGRLYSWPEGSRKARLGRRKVDPVQDYRYMEQIISSAITNAPPPDMAVRVQQWFGRAGFTNKRTRNKMVRLFKDHHSRKKLLNRQGTPC